MRLIVGGEIMIIKRIQALRKFKISVRLFDLNNSVCMCVCV